MGQIRKQTIQSSFLSYIGFGIGTINTFFFARLFTTDQYGLTQVIISISQILAPLATFGMVAYINKFFPYYFANLDNRKNDLLTVAVIGCLVGSLLTFGGSLIFEPLVVRKFSGKSALVVKYYYWSLVFSFFYTCFLVLESYLGALKKTVLPNFMRETAYRILVLILIGLYAFDYIDFRAFMIGFCCIYLLIVAIIVGYLLFIGKLHLSLQISNVSKRFRKKVTTYVSFIYLGLVINSIAKQIDTLALAGARNLSAAGIYTLNQFMAAILQVPYRGMQSIGGPLIAEHWRNKNHAEIARIYQRSAINLLLLSMLLFFNIWLNYDDGLHFLGIEKQYAAGKTVFLILGIYNMLELGTGINSAVISTSPAWRFEFISGMLLLCLSIPLNIYMARWNGMEGVAFAQLITFTVYNTVRLLFIKKRFDIWPFSMKTVYSILLGAGSYTIAWLLFHNIHGIGGIILRSALFSGCFVGGIYFLHLTPDFKEVMHVVQKKLKRK